MSPLTKEGNGTPAQNDIFFNGYTKRSSQTKDRERNY